MRQGNFDKEDEQLVSSLMPEILSLRKGESVDDVPDPRVDVAEDACAAAEAADLRRYVRELPPHEREVINLRFGLDTPPRSHRAIAADMHVAVGTIWNTEQRALTMLRTLYGGHRLHVKYDA
jgi:DNA-directed RNA polymerase specialized sigma24 family protein